MAAYAALVSVMHIIDNLQTHCRPPITLHKEQVHLLTEKVTFLQEFLQIYNPNLPYSKDADPLETRISHVAYAAEDAIESHILDHFTDNNGEKMNSYSLYGALEKVIEDMSLIEKEAVKIKEIGGFQNKLHAKSTPPDSSRSSSSSIAQKKKKKSTMVGANDLLLELKSRLTTDAHDLQVIPIVGMGGSGKTTLASNIYHDGLIKEHFEIRAWVTISQEYSILGIVKQVLPNINQNLSEGELGQMFHKHFFRRQYMIILDDMWSIEAWDGVKWFLPNNKNGSRIVITTRLTTLASTLSSSNTLRMKLLDENDSWDLLSKTVFGEKGCPPEFEDIGNKIGKSCKGLPLSIVVVGGLLAKSEQSIESWKYTLKNLNAIVNLEDGEHCLKTLYMSYKQLPVHMKPCFLYMGIYHEDHQICISKLIRLWVAEGFLKPMSGKRLEDVARAYINDLTDRNLILIHKLGSTGSIKYCKVHDLLRDLCLREARKEGFYLVCPGYEIRDKASRIVISGSISEIEGIDALSFVPLARSLILDFGDGKVPPLNLKVLRTLGSNITYDELIDKVHQLVNSRFFSFCIRKTEFPSLIWQFWNLQTLIVSRLEFEMSMVPSDVWYMSHIRHLDFNLLYHQDPPNVQDGIVLTNLQSLGWITGFRCSEEVVKRIPNIRKLRITYEMEVDDRFCLTNLDCLNKLESLNFIFDQPVCLIINYPQSLKKLKLQVHPSQCWQDILDKVGELPLLQKLQLISGTFKEGKWETTEGQFRNLKFLLLLRCEGLQVWTSEASHFPRLEQLHLLNAPHLEGIPSNLPTLRLINMRNCSDFAIESAKSILEEQEALYGEEDTTLQVYVFLSTSNDPTLNSSWSPNFLVESLHSL